MLIVHSVLQYAIYKNNPSSLTRHTAALVFQWWWSIQQSSFVWLIVIDGVFIRMIVGIFLVIWIVSIFIVFKLDFLVLPVHIDW